MMKLSLAHIGPAFNATYVNYLIPTVRENSCHAPRETLRNRRPLAGSIALIMRGYTIMNALIRWNRTRAQVDFPLNATVLSKPVHIIPWSFW
ncbi:hypothetical protein EG68_03930 [Paragonimus skrjabini miyazakii]|uniref:Uncharacterized protein n=1 Tax=Paragonimus skrjabini miyazakii TaxID=59628 RepID=A0A8S9Z037_9TREM|nr:hypothetical protein EG68_03930 [Paragonimus skrjabini miyazakii]